MKKLLLLALLFSFNALAGVEIKPTVGSSSNFTTTGAEIDLSGTPSVALEVGSWIDSITDNTTGDVTINVTSGTFSAEPSCTCATIEGGADNYSCSLRTKSASAIRVLVSDFAGTEIDRDFNIVCYGAN